MLSPVLLNKVCLIVASVAQCDADFSLDLAAAYAGGTMMLSPWMQGVTPGW